MYSRRFTPNNVYIRGCGQRSSRLADTDSNGHSVYRMHTVWRGNLAGICPSYTGLVPRDPRSPLVVDDTSQTRRIYDDLRRSIITGVYREGEKLPEARLAELLGTSRLPV